MSIWAGLTIWKNMAHAFLPQTHTHHTQHERLLHIFLHLYTHLGRHLYSFTPKTTSNKI